MGAKDDVDPHEEDATTASMRAHRPATIDASSLEQRLAIASILDASSALIGASAASAAGAASATETPPLRLGRLEVQSKIGSGGMGVVYRAWDPDLQRVVAVKVLRGLERSAVEEARALARVSHPNVVTVFDVVHEAGELCFVMEHIEGCTLRAWIDRHPDAAWREVLEWFVQAGRGIVAAHTAGLVHQDVKPENVLIGDDGRARVVDFGLARWTDASAAAGAVNLSGGTPRYMAPEVAEGSAATEASDQYSFCIALRDALGLTPTGAAAAEPEPARAARRPPDVVIEAVARGTQRDPQARFASFAELMGVLQRAMMATTRSTASASTAGTNGNGNAHGSGNGTNGIGTGASEHARMLLLERVERLWLKGVLDRSLAGGGVVDVELHGAPALVNPPWERPSDLEKTTAHQLQHALRASNGSLLLVGPPGSGKTTLSLLLCRELWRTATIERNEPAPVVLSLSTYQPETRADKSLAAHFARWVVDEIIAKYGLPRPAVTRWLEASSIVLLLDGLDETDARLRDRVVDTLNAFRKEQPLSIAVTCRDAEYEALGSRLAFGAALRVQPLDDDGAARLVEARRAHRSHASWLASVRNPLLLTLLADDAADALNETRGVPPWSVAYERYIDRAFSAHHVTREERQRVENQLRYLARAMRAHNTSDLWLERLHFGWLERRWEQVAAYVMGIVAVLLFGVGLNVAQVPITGNPLASALIFGIGVSLSSFAYTRGRIKPVESLRWSWRRMLRLLPITTVCATIVGLAEALRINFAANLVGAGITGAILGISFALDSGDRAGKVRPNAGIHRSLAHALVLSFGFGVPAGLLFGLVVNPFIRVPLIDVVEGTGNHSLMVGVSVGLFVFTAMFLIYGGFTVFMHSVLRLWLAWRTPLPLDVQRALDRAVELQLMRRVGGGYVFLHRTLLDYFARP